MSKKDLIDTLTYLIEYYSSFDELSDFDRGLLHGYNYALEKLKEK